MKDLVVFRCKNCIDELKVYNPYIYPDGSRVPLKKIEVVQVPRKFCENFESNLTSTPQLQTPIFRNKTIKKPWLVKFWETEDDRENGIATVYDRFESFKRAKGETISAGRMNSWASAEIYLDTGDQHITVFFFDGEKPKESFYVKHTGVSK